MIKIPIEISARHIHLSKKDLEVLFGKGYKLKKLKPLTQLGEFAAKETLDVAKNGKKLLKVRVVGPERSKTQVEMSFTDAFSLGILDLPVMKSGSVKGSPGALLIGKKGKLQLKEGLISSQRHIHLNTAEVKKLKLKNGQLVSIKVLGKRAVTFHNVLIRVSESGKLCLHLDTDEGNAAGVIKKGEGILL